MNFGGAIGWISTGLAGLLVGATLGLLLTVFFEDSLKSFLSRIRRKMRTSYATSASTEPSDFQFGGLTSPCIIVAGDGADPIKEELIHLVVSDEPVELPPELAAWRQEVLVEEEAKRASGSRHHWNGPHFAVEDLVEERSGRDEEVEIFLKLRRSDYFSFLASQNLDRRFRDGSTPRNRYIDPIGHRRAPVFMSLSLGASVLVITTDNKALVCQRGADVGSRPLHWGVSADEGLNPDLDCPGNSSPRLHAAARRGLREELSLEDHEYRISLLGITIDTDRHQWDSVFIAYVHDLTSEDLDARLRRGTKDKTLEIENWEFLPFDTKSVLRAMRRGGKSKKWTPIALPAFYLALVSEYGRWRVERSAKRFSKNRHNRPTS